MTFRAIVIGLTGAMLIAGAGYLHDQLAMGRVLESWARTSITAGTLLPYFVNSLRLCSLADLKPWRVGVATNLTYVAGVALAIIVVLWANYNWGITRDSWGYSNVPKMAFSRLRGKDAHFPGTGHRRADSQPALRSGGPDRYPRR